MLLQIPESLRFLERLSESGIVGYMEDQMIKIQK